MPSKIRKKKKRPTISSIIVMYNNNGDQCKTTTTSCYHFDWLLADYYRLLAGVSHSSSITY
jgi:hypothetical protein